MMKLKHVLGLGLLAAASDDKAVERGAERTVGLEDLRPRAQPFGEEAQLGPDGRRRDRNCEVVVTPGLEHLIQGLGRLIRNQCEDRAAGAVGGAQGGQERGPLVTGQAPVDEADHWVGPLDCTAAVARSGGHVALVARGLDLSDDRRCEVAVGGCDLEAQLPRRCRAGCVLSRRPSARQSAEDPRESAPAHIRRFRGRGACRAVRAQKILTMTESACADIDPQARQ
jgi:hypothetical protein